MFAILQEMNSYNLFTPPFTLEEENEENNFMIEDIQSSKSYSGEGIHMELYTPERTSMSSAEVATIVATANAKRLQGIHKIFFFPISL